MGVNTFGSWRPFTFTWQGREESVLFELHGNGTSSYSEEVRSQGVERSLQGLAKLGHDLVENIRTHGGTMHIKHWPMSLREYRDADGKVRNAAPSEVVAATMHPGLRYNGQTQVFTLS